MGGGPWQEGVVRNRKGPGDLAPEGFVGVEGCGAAGGGYFPLCATAGTVISRRRARRVWKAEGLLRQEETPEGLIDCTIFAQTLPGFLQALLEQRN